MMLGAIVICPDCVGNRGFCRDGDTAIMPPYEIAAMAEAVRSALEMRPSEADRMRVAASAMTARHSLEVERNGFLSILEAL
jgi:glycosyltransferase involved in cell wall biosynthesis